VAAAEVSAWAERAQRLARLMAVGAEVDAPAGARALDGLQARVLALHARPYLARGVAERALLLLAALLQVPARARAPRRAAPCRARSASPAPGRMQATAGVRAEACLRRGLGRLCEASADALAAYAGVALQCFWAPPEAAARPAHGAPVRGPAPARAPGPGPGARRRAAVRRRSRPRRRRAGVARRCRRRCRRSPSAPSSRSTQLP
jgi:hypothetical protein